MNELTAIIPFLNEGVEIENTLQSIRATAGDTIDILLVNDCSTDDFDYETIALRYSARYHKNKERMGVAASRDWAVSMITTPYFLLLDGHMRFYNDQWVKRIVEELKKEEKLLLCCQTEMLYKKNDQIVSFKSSAFGAYIDLSGNENLLDAVWNGFETDSNAIVEDIPCILGAAYACSQKYWQYLKGLSGLMYYGSDETYISLKVWLNGGKCQLLKDVVVGHIYRNVFPYKVEGVHTTYNKLLLAELLLPDKLKETVFSQSKASMGEVFVSANRILKEKETQISVLKRYYRSIFVVDFEIIYEWNAKITRKHDDRALQKIADYLMQNTNRINDVGLLHGKMGIVIFFAHYAQYTGNLRYDEFLEALLDEIYNSVGRNTSVYFQSGLCGIGWGIEYLVQNGLMQGDTDDILKEIDKKVMKLNFEDMEDISLEQGLAGILSYVYARLLSACWNKRKASFRQAFLIRLSKKASCALSERKGEETPDIISRFLSFLEENNKPEKSIRLNHIVALPKYFDNQFERQALGLQFGYAGVGLKKMRIT